MTSERPPSRATREELEQLWRSRLDEAQKRYEAAAQQERDLREPQTIGRAPDPNGSSARHAKSEARAEFRRVLRIFTELVVHGKEPAEPPPDRSEQG